ncbi:MAG: type II secretion system F family protein [Candidatus Omnitrophota bacterium]
MPIIVSILILVSVSLLLGLLLTMQRKGKDESGSTQEPDKPKKSSKDKSHKINTKQIILLFIASPIIMGMFAGTLLSKNLLVVLGGGFVGLVIPALWIKGARQRMIKKFESQLPDSLMILTSCLRGGLSLIQSVEVLTEEMPYPTNVEFSQLLKENKMGISLEESLQRLNQRMPFDDLVLLSSAVMVSRETGGDLTEVFTRLNDSIRARNKLLEQVKTLTLQGKIQSIILSALPVVFSVAVFKISPNYLQLLTGTDTGRIMLVIAGVLLAIGLLLVRIFSKVEV